jgi:hypothetical protein
MTILDRVEASLAGFRPRNQAEFVALQIARRFDDLHRFPRYIATAKRHSKPVLLHMAREAITRHTLNRTPLPDLFFEIVNERERKEGP